MDYYLIKLGNKKSLINFEYIEKLEKKKRMLKNSVKKILIHWKSYILNFQ